jgi:hypothetical protein
MPVFGSGIPSGTTVSAINSTISINLSASATVSTVVTQTGTVSTTASTMTVSAGSNLIAGANVSGTYIPTGTTISSISSNTVTLSQRPYWFTRQATYIWGMFGSTLSPEISMTDVTNIVVGMRVFGSHGVNTTVSYVSTNYIVLTVDPGAPARGSFYILDLYFIPASPSSATYTFNSPNSFVFRSVDGSLPFGSYPGVGGAYA